MEVLPVVDMEDPSAPTVIVKVRGNYGGSSHKTSQPVRHAPRKRTLLNVIERTIDFFRGTIAIKAHDKLQKPCLLLCHPILS